MRRWAVLGMTFVLLLAPLAGRAAAQDTELAGRGPRFLWSTLGTQTPVDVGQVPVLRRRVSLDLQNATLDQALQEISRQSGMRLMYSKDVITLDAKVQLQAKSITVAAALTELLVDAGVDVILTRTGQAMLARQRTRVSMAAGTVTGRVTDAKTGDPITGAEVWLDGTRHRATSSDKGYYKLTDVPTGNYTLSARRVGFAKQSRAVIVTEGELTADVALQPVVTQLDELVTTVTGEQRARELGHVIGRINADSVVREAPVSSLSELLTARVSGFQVFQNQGTVGGVVKLQSRAPNSFLLKSEPIVVVDGVRFNSAALQRTFTFPYGFGPAAVEPTSPLNNLAPSDIETIEVVKGPSAATLYGTDAANGVVVITTKRGRPGHTQWNTYGKAQSNGIPKQHFRDSYYPWGHTPADPNTAIRCSLGSVVSNYCVQDSVVAIPSPLNDPEWSMLAGQPAWNYGGNVNGGSQQFKYYLSADVNDATGPLRMPQRSEEQLKEQMGLDELPVALRRPNATSEINLRANVSADLGRATTVGVTTAYMRGWTRSLSADNNPYSSAALSATPGVPYGSYRTPATVFQSTSTERHDRFFGSTNAQWRPISWLQARAQVGIDLNGRNRYSFTPPNVDLQGFDQGAVGDERLRQLAITGDVSATALVRKGRVTFRSSVGAQYVRSTDDQLQSYGYDLPPGGTSVGEAINVSTRQIYNEVVTLGSFLEETVGLNDRLFATAAVRLDGASAFGQNYDIATYPKVSLSWILSDEPFMPRIPGLSELRLRFARGASGMQAKSAWAHLGYTVSRGKVDGKVQPMVTVSNLGNPNMRPERVTENEFGFDAGAFSSRVRLGMSWYNRRTSDQITTRGLGSSFGFIYDNLGLTTQHGFEIDFHATPIESRLVSFDVNVTHGLHRNKLVDYGRPTPLTPVNNPNGGLAEGYSIGARFMTPIISYTDQDGNGIITSNEIVYSPDAVYVGEGTPPISQTLSTVLSFFERRVRVSALFERKRGFVQFDQIQVNRCFNANCYELVALGASLRDQALARAAYERSYAEPQKGDFTRFREMSVAMELPLTFARHLRVRSASIAVAVRNLALWSKFSGPDPEAAAIGGQNQFEPLYSAGYADGVPLARSWSFRVDLGL